MGETEKEREGEQAPKRESERERERKRKGRNLWSNVSDGNLVPEELDLVPGSSFSCWFSSCKSLVPGLVPDPNFSSWVSS